MTKTVYAVYKTNRENERTLISYCDDPMGGAQVIERDIQDSDDNAKYELVRETIGKETSNATTD